MLTSLDNLRLLSSPQAASNKRKKRCFGDQPRPQRYVGCAQHTLPSPPRPAKGRQPLGTLLQKNAFYKEKEVFRGSTPPATLCWLRSTYAPLSPAPRQGAAAPWNPASEKCIL